MKRLRIVFMGTPEFAVASLNALLNSQHEVVAVVTVPDKPAGRGQKLHQSDVKQFAVSKGLPVLQPEKLRDEAFLEELRGYAADLFVVVAFRMLPEVVWQMPPIGTFNLHGSLLPRYRGAAPINWAIINGDSKSGVTTFFLKHEIDTGNILFQEEVEIGSEDNAGVLHDNLMEVGAKLVVKTANAIANGDAKFIDQEELIKRGNEPVHAPKIFKEDCRIVWSNGVDAIHNRIRGLSPYPAAWFEMVKEEHSVNVKVYKSQKEKILHSHSIGTIVSDGKNFVKVACADGYISIAELQLAGKKRMPVKDFLLGFKDITNYTAQ
ncbi:methionyl-tRNA formyltransferase [Acetobacteroides hydrogenigenes]|uniref:Methionyl-tRNA formyltransferase n=1 Tax=Acetobacteroides hydrogenigenes TaxID=979970 RepID=A0A4R2EPH7_9BACT|nr:methionyl-tRNA formyltransferase [Acetobacteroides hydrogenigenes]TCN70681.1 methionyl-tRNA formyltransferase [Acetobacteroides hydrogenigenes]